MYAHESAEYIFLSAEAVSGVIEKLIVRHDILKEQKKKISIGKKN